MKFKRRVPVPADSVAVHCGEGELTIQVKQNFLGSSRFLVWVAPPELCLMCLLKCEVGQGGVDEALGADCCGTDCGRGDQYYVSSYILVQMRGALDAPMLTLQRCIRKPFHLSCV